MRKKILIFLSFPLLLQAQEQHIGSLFDALKTHPQTKGDEIDMKQALAGKTMAVSNLYPTIDLFGRYDYASIPTAMLPLPPNEMFPMSKDPSLSQPFSQNIFRIGAAISMPVFVKSIYTTASKAQILYHSAENKRQINLLKNEAVIVSLNANLLYMDALLDALDKKKISLLKTKEFISIATNNGRTPESALLKINDGVNEIDLLKNDVALQREEVLSSINALTGILLPKAVNMQQIGTYQNGEMKSLDPIRKKLQADKMGLRAEKEKLLPSLVLQGNYSNNFAKSYNNNQSINNDYTTIGVILKVPLFTKSQYAQIKKSKLDVEASENELSKMTLELSSQATQLEKSLLLLDNSVELYNNSIKDKENLLEIARVSYKSEQISLEDYLKYEDDVVLEKSKLYKSQAQRWQTLVKLAVIYGNNIEEIIK